MIVLGLGTEKCHNNRLPCGHRRVIQRAGRRLLGIAVLAPSCRLLTRGSHAPMGLHRASVANDPTAPFIGGVEPSPFAIG
jgi:hypothetical protein